MIALTQIVFAASVLALCTAAYAAKLSGQYRTDVIDRCMDNYADDPDFAAIKGDTAKVRKYCTCEMDAYWEQVPQDDYNAMILSEQVSPAIAEKVEGRLQKAMTQCRPKFGLPTPR